MAHIRITFVADVDEELFPKNDEERLAFAKFVFDDPYLTVDVRDEDNTQLVFCSSEGDEFTITPFDVADAEAAEADDDIEGLD
ncbi:hypothetical protein [Microcystis phage Mel-JY34]